MRQHPLRSSASNSPVPSKPADVGAKIPDAGGAPEEDMSTARTAYWGPPDTELVRGCGGQDVDILTIHVDEFPKQRQ
ncbi:unnamed protein product [Cylicocyclus nassatus]|uniref:Uncharacterized protein n=1 Tax=Cylicocyclus nassatus TaxID=53992 RepID=A0AA36GEQ9_CYLNA|nr:unnamed protein product [Cylicocyclus nassatus]